MTSRSRRGRGGGRGGNGGRGRGGGSVRHGEGRGSQESEGNPNPNDTASNPPASSSSLNSAPEAQISSDTVPSQASQLVPPPQQPRLPPAQPNDPVSPFPWDEAIDQTGFGVQPQTRPIPSHSPPLAGTMLQRRLPTLEPSMRRPSSGLSPGPFSIKDSTPSKLPPGHVPLTSFISSMDQTQAYSASSQAEGWPSSVSNTGPPSQDLSEAAAVGDMTSHIISLSPQSPTSSPLPPEPNAFRSIDGFLFEHLSARCTPAEGLPTCMVVRLPRSALAAISSTSCVLIEPSPDAVKSIGQLSSMYGSRNFLISARALKPGTEHVKLEDLLTDTGWPDSEGNYPKSPDGLEQVAPFYATLAANGLSKRAHGTYELRNLPELIRFNNDEPPDGLNSKMSSDYRKVNGAYTNSSVQLGSGLRDSSAHRAQLTIAVPQDGGHMGDQRITAGRVPEARNISPHSREFESAGNSLQSSRLPGQSTARLTRSANSVDQFRPSSSHMDFSDNSSAPRLSTYLPTSSLFSNELTFDLFIMPDMPEEAAGLRGPYPEFKAYREFFISNHMANVARAGPLTLILKYLWFLYRATGLHTKFLFNGLKVLAKEFHEQFTGLWGSESWGQNYSMTASEGDNYQQILRHASTMKHALDKTTRSSLSESPEKLAIVRRGAKEIARLLLRISRDNYENIQLDATISGLSNHDFVRLTQSELSFFENSKSSLSWSPVQLNSLDLGSLKDFDDFNLSSQSRRLVGGELVHQMLPVGATLQRPSTASYFTQKVMTEHLEENFMSSDYSNDMVQLIFLFPRSLPEGEPSPFPGPGILHVQTLHHSRSLTGDTLNIHHLSQSYAVPGVQPTSHTRILELRRIALRDMRARLWKYGAAMKVKAVHKSKTVYSLQSLSGLDLMRNAGLIGGLDARLDIDSRMADIHPEFPPKKLKYSVDAYEIALRSLDEQYAVFKGQLLAQQSIQIYLWDFRSHSTGGSFYWLDVTQYVQRAMALAYARVYRDYLVKVRANVAARQRFETSLLDSIGGGRATSQPNDEAEAEAEEIPREV